MLVPLTLAGRQRIEAAVDLVPLERPLPVACGVVELAQHPLVCLSQSRFLRLQHSGRPKCRSLRASTSVASRMRPKVQPKWPKLSEHPGCYPATERFGNLHFSLPKWSALWKNMSRPYGLRSLSMPAHQAGAFDCMVGHAWQP